jgi:hypothetical protein
VSPHWNRTTLFFRDFLKLSAKVINKFQKSEFKPDFLFVCLFVLEIKSVFTLMTGIFVPFRTWRLGNFLTLSTEFDKNSSK